MLQQTIGNGSYLISLSPIFYEKFEIKFRSFKKKIQEISLIMLMEFFFFFTNGCS